MRIFLLFVAALFVFSSCTVTQTIAINADQMGAILFSIDYSNMAAMSKNDTVPYDPLAGINVDSTVKAMNQIEGINGTKFYKDNNKVHFAYQFNSLEALNIGLHNINMVSSLTNIDLQPQKPHTYYSGTAHSLTYTSLPIDKKDKEKMQESIAMATMLTLKTTIHLPGKVTKLSNNNYEISSNRKSISYSVTMDKVLSGEVNTDFTVKF